MKPNSARPLNEKEWNYLEKRLKEGPTIEQRKIIQDSVKIYNNIKERK